MGQILESIGYVIEWNDELRMEGLLNLIKRMIVPLVRMNLVCMRELMSGRRI